MDGFPSMEFYLISLDFEKQHQLYDYLGDLSLEIINCTVLNNLLS